MKLTSACVFYGGLVSALVDIPYEVECPTEPLIRKADINNRELCTEEDNYISQNLKTTKENLQNYLAADHGSIYLSDAIMSTMNASVPRLGIAISGGGYRSMLTATGFIQEMKRDGLYDCINYIAGVSGGSWLLMDLILHDFNTNYLLNDWNLDDGILKGVPELKSSERDIATDFDPLINFEVDNIQKRDIHSDAETKKDVSPLIKIKDFLISNVGNLREAFNSSKNLFSSDPDSDPHSFSTFQQVLKFYIELHLSVRPKKVKGFQVSFTDYWGKALMKILKNNVLSSKESTSLHKIVTEAEKFKKHQVPFPIFVANCRNGLLRNVIFEFTPFEFGSWDNLSRLFVKIKYLGSQIVGGTSLKCIRNYDDIAYITATSSSVFNNVLLYALQVGSKSSRETIKAIKIIMNNFGLVDLKFNKSSRTFDSLETHYALYQHNPFFRYPEVDNVLTSHDHLYLVDGGEDGENIPLRTLTIPERKLDLIFALDSSSDFKNYANGTKLITSFKHFDPSLGYELLEENFIQKIAKYRKRPFALGCYNSNFEAPIILYYSNQYYNYPSNSSTFKITYNKTEIKGMIKNGNAIYNANNDNYNKNCIKCLISMRSLQRNGTTDIPDFCKNCYKSYCYS